MSPIPKLRLALEGLLYQKHHTVDEESWRVFDMLELLPQIESDMEALRQENYELRKQGLSVEHREILLGENRRLRGALEWYADSGNYCHDNESKHIATAYENGRLEKKAKEAITPNTQSGI